VQEENGYRRERERRWLGRDEGVDPGGVCRFYLEKKKKKEWEKGEEKAQEKRVKRRCRPDCTNQT